MQHAPLSSKKPTGDYKEKQNASHTLTPVNLTSRGERELQKSILIN